ncbi:NADPH-dependent FMN reductase [Parasediminibacterium sp. JCM 36343]|uniref:NADPH-dependent FMN reductase n=1 Tax=Parasediminibacterium sp. JCM 36343 TaxID=3374279 RepID=UPI00397E1BDF
MMNIEIVSGSPRSASITVRIAHYLQQYLQQHYGSHNIGLIDVREWKLGQLDHVFNTVENTPEAFKPLAKRMLQANAFIIVTPEYNGSYSSEIKNLFDHFPKQSRKAFGLCTASVGALGGARCTQTLLLFVPALFGIASPSLLIVPGVDKKFNEQSELIDPAFEKQIHVFATEFMWLAATLTNNPNI